MALGFKGKVRIGITGSDGLLGYHARLFFHGQPGFDVVCADRGVMDDKEAFLAFVDGCDVIVHCAGMNRGDDKDILRTNVALTDQLIAACEKKKTIPHIFFPSSLHIARETSYGISKRICAERLGTWAVRNKGLFTNMILPNVFGEGGRPFYNSVVSTFCHQLAQGQEPNIIQDREVELLHAMDVARFIFEAIPLRTAKEVRLQGVSMQVSNLLKVLRSFHDLYNQNIIPNIGKRIDLQLFNTLRSYRESKCFLGDFSMKEDFRGSLAEIVKSHNGGQCFLSHTNPGVIRGNHYHMEKFERFAVVSGKGVIRLRKLFSAEVTTLEVSGDNMQYVDIPTLYTHQIENVGPGDLITLFWSNTLFDPNNTDTFAESL